MAQIRFFLRNNDQLKQLTDLSRYFGGNVNALNQTIKKKLKLLPCGIFFLAGHRYGLKFYNTLAIKSGGENKYFVYTFLNQIFKSKPTNSGACRFL